MSFPKNMWFPDGFGSLANEEISLDALARTELKRGHQWMMDTSDPNLLFNKKQAVDFVNAASGPVMITAPLWSDALSSDYGSQINVRGSIQHSDVLDEGEASICSAAVDTETKCLQNQFSSGLPVHFAMPQPGEGDPSLVSSGFVKVKPEELNISENCLPHSSRSSFYLGDELISSTLQFNANNLPARPIYNSAHCANFVDPAFSKIDDKSFIPFEHGLGNRYSNFMLANPYYSDVDKDALSVFQATNSGSSNSVEQYDKDYMSLAAASENFFSVDPVFSKLNEAFMSSLLNYSKGDTTETYPNNAVIASVGALYKKDSISSSLETFEKPQETPFGGFPCKIEETQYSERFLRSDGVQSNHPSGCLLRWKDSLEQLTVTPLTQGTDGAQMNKDMRYKKGSSSAFPTNVKSLLSTGILDGVPVKYVSWSREKNLRGVIKGTGYLCSCEECKISKVKCSVSRVVNAYEFECHAGCKTKHPNNHIYFENGKTIYAVVQELKNTPPEKLFEAIQNSTGSPVNQKNFDAWKASFQAANPEVAGV